MATTPVTEPGAGDAPAGPTRAGRPVVAPVLTCTECGGGNAVDSRFCRHCGAEFSVSAAPVDAVPIVPVAIAPAPDVDEGRARQLLDHAFMLTERGDIPGAIHACRQSISLSPQGYSMLGLLLERAGDPERAAAAYTRVLELAPGSRLEQESLDRLRAKLAASGASPTQFRFDDRDLFGDAFPSAGVSASPVAPGAATPFDRSGAAAPVAAGGVSTAAALNAGLLDDDSAIRAATVAPAWRRVAQRPTFYFRGLPLVAVTGVGLLFMTWGRNAALSRQPLAPVVGAAVDPAASSGSSTDTGAGSAVVDPGAVAPVPAVPGAAGTPVPGVAGPGDSLPVTNQAVGANGAQANGNNGASAANGAPGSNGAGGNRSGGNGTGGASRRVPGGDGAGSVVRPVPAFPSVNRSVAPARPQNLPPARIESVPPAPASPRAGSASVPSSSGGSNAVSAGGGPMNPSGNSGQGYITLSRPRPTAAPARPSNRANDAERAAAREGAAGRGGNALNTINEAIRADNGGDTGWRYQQRALLFLERGDYQRAADDFQTAIGAYRDQIRRGERTSEAQSGIRACQSGLSLALANLRR
jgi:tetratricopeptide (TPR) repeat protein